MRTGHELFVFSNGTRCREKAIKARQTVRFRTTEFVIILYYTHRKISTPPTFGLPRLASFPRFPGHQCIIQTNRYTSGKIFVRASLCARYYYIRVRVHRTRYTHYVHCIHVGILLPPSSTCARGPRGLPQPYSCHRDEYTTAV